ncbi:uncharacterized protein LOC143466550 isoform X1 [Clavelina lepadiformis]|uniref:uncharacterized protein LOC143466550 isoform X1 n=1 Tax=Clavelina lepadiformis TaxID=159417 RepID=UPI0040428AF0
MAASSNCSPATGPFRATRIWNNLVQHLQENANVKRRRNVKKCYEECFTGANAVDVLHHFVRRNPEQFSNNTTIARENIVRLCQSFLDNQIFEQAGVGSNAEKNPKFDDSTSSLYQFTGKGRKESDVKSHNGRQVLRAIDGDIRNSLGHITISNEQNAMHETTLKSKNILIPTRKQGNRSHFPSFGGISAHSLKDTFMSSAHGSESEGESSDSRSGRPLKRSASFRFVTKRSSSESGVHQGLSSTSTCSDAEDVKEKKSDDINRGGKLRLSQRLSFRKKSVSSNQQIELLDIKDLATSSISALPPHGNTRLQGQKKHSQPVVEILQQTTALNPRRKSIAMKQESAKPCRSLRKIISSPTLLGRRSRQSYNFVEVEKQVPLVSETSQQHLASVNNNSRRQFCATPATHRVSSPHDFESSPTKIMRQDVIKETPSRFRSSKSNYLGSLGGFVQRMSKRKPIRRAEQSSLNGDHSCVIKNPVADRDSRCGSQNGKDTIHRKLTSQELSHLKRECVRVRLLQILDLQFVDGLITSPNYDKRASSSDFNGLFSSSSCASHGVQYSEVVSAYNSADSWISSALSVLQHLPNGYDILCRHARDQPYMKKIKLFFAISDYYKSLSKPLIDDSMKDIIKAIVQMLASKPADVALEALQLFMHLLTESLLYELRDLFAFLHYVITNKDVALTPQCSNKKIVIQTFPSAIFPTIAKDRQFPDFQSGICGLCYFIMDQRQQAFSLPPSVTSTMNRKRKLMEAGEVDSPSLVPDSTFCARISNTEYNKQRVDFTQMQVSELIKSLHTDTSMPPRKKKDLLKKMQSAHSSAFERSRGPMKVIHANPITAAETTPQVAHRKSVAKTPTSDPFNRKSNKSRKVYV